MRFLRQKKDLSFPLLQWRESIGILSFPTKYPFDTQYPIHITRYSILVQAFTLAACTTLSQVFRIEIFRANPTIRSVPSVAEATLRVVISQEAEWLSTGVN